MIWLLVFFLISVADGALKITVNRPACADDTKNIKASILLPSEPPNQYTLKINKEIHSYSQMILRFDSEVSLKLIEPTDAQISKFPGPSNHSNQFIVTFIGETSYVGIHILSPASGDSVPYVISIILNDEELCGRPQIGYFDFLFPEKRSAETSLRNESCGRRKVGHIELIVQGQATQPGDWPWHAAILMVNVSSLSYICGGTLLSKTLVLTAAHCTTVGSNPVTPYSLSVVLGKYNLYGGDIAAQERRVFEVIFHPGFDVKTLNNDIALIRLNSEAIFDDYVQPACLWHTALSTVDDFGTVAGWGFDNTDSLSSTLQKTTVPIVSELTCLKSNPIFFHQKLDTNKFCAGFANGTSPCNGDSGGGLMIFVPDTAGDTGNVSGAWYVRGIVSLAARRSGASICDPYQYTICTDVEKYRDWVMEYLK